MVMALTQILCEAASLRDHFFVLNDNSNLVRPFIADNPMHYSLSADENRLQLFNDLKVASCYPNVRCTKAKAHVRFQAKEVTDFFANWKSEVARLLNLYLPLKPSLLLRMFLVSVKFPGTSSAPPSQTTPTQPFTRPSVSLDLDRNEEETPNVMVADYNQIFHYFCRFQQIGRFHQAPTCSKSSSASTEYRSIDFSAAIQPIAPNHKE